MDRATISRIEEWDTRPTSAGYAGINELADDGFTGAAVATGTTLLMLNGKIVGVADGTVASFDGADVTAYEAPDPALPLLFTMQEREGEVRGSYYTDDTPIREVDETLTEGGFTGYLELSENVLSGDYYVVYYGGRSLAVAFVGNNARVVTGEEAFQLAADEVGIYEVRTVDLDVIDVPETTSGAAAGAEEPGEEVTEPDDGGGEPVDEGTDTVDEDAEPESDVSPEAVGSGESEPEAESDVDSPPAAAEDTEPDVGIPDAEATESDETTADEPPAESAGAGREEPATDAREASSQVSAPAPRTSGEEPVASESPGRPASEQRDPAPAEPDERFEEEARWRETRTVPALDPEESEPPVASAEPEQPPEPVQEPATDQADEADQRTADAAVQGLEERLRRLEGELESSERERERLADRVEAVAEERDDIAEEREALEARIEQLEGQLERARTATESAGGGGSSSAGRPSGRSIDPETALDQTDLFVRYGSKSKPTLATAHDGAADAETVAENLRIDSHSRFDSATVTVDGRPFADYLEGTIQYRFVTWLIEVLLYEIRATGTEGGLRALYDVLPDIDRAEFNGTVASTDEEGETVSETFDVVCRNRMGKALVVANINDSLDPATGEMMGTLVEDATEVAEAHGSIGAAFLVTASFFQPDALETAADATRGGGFLSRDSKKSFVKLSRNGGYHLCLVEARGDDFHVAVPEF